MSRNGFGLLKKIVDALTHEALAVEVGCRLCGEDVVRLRNRLSATRGVPSRIFMNKRSEVLGNIGFHHAHCNKVRMDFSRPGRPADNCFIETLNGSMRNEFLVFY